MATQRFDTPEALIEDQRCWYAEGQTDVEAGYRPHPPQDDAPRAAYLAGYQSVAERES